MNVSSVMVEIKRKVPQISQITQIFFDTKT